MEKREQKEEESKEKKLKVAGENGRNESSTYANKKEMNRNKYNL